MVPFECCRARTLPAPNMTFRSPTKTAWPNQLWRLRINSGADVVVLGSYTTLSGNGDKRIRLDVRVQDTVRGETIRSNPLPAARRTFSNSPPRPVRRFG
jgi:hypothetical protein